MNLKPFAVAMAFALSSLTGCGGDDGAVVPEFTTQIFSDPALDGDIEQASPTALFVTQSMSPTVQSVFVGIDPTLQSEFRAFLNFPLSGSGGVPGDAIIDTAFLDIFIDSMQPNVGSIPLLIELVSIRPPTLLESDFDRTLQPPLVSVRVPTPITQADVGSNVSIDVTALMVQAQLLGLNEFQVRILEDLGPAIPVLVEIDDTTAADRASFAPALTVTYF